MDVDFSIKRLLLGIPIDKFVDLRPDHVELNLALSFVNRISLWMIKDSEGHAAEPFFGNARDYSRFVGRL